ncbi:MAG: ferritin [Bacteroidales bacterium]|nr:ferritin [Bacteroides sp.]MCM1198906.1 ferritin [Clostridium sp.]MCM1502660.1 ferritin [Bacteroidales bacterium]
MISKNLQNVINDQVTAELWSSNLYLQMAFFLEKEGWNGSAHWMYKQAAEEREHALDMAHYLMQRGGEAKVAMIDVVPEGWGSLTEIFEHVYSHECHVSELINKVVDAAAAENDKATYTFFLKYVSEQVEEEATAAEIVDKLKKAGEQGAFFVDSQLGAR